MAIVLDGTSGITGNSGTLLSNSTIGVGGTTPAASGAGISFPATQSASTDVNTLDDYEEGTWTPVVTGSTSAGTGTYTVQVGNYTKVGNLVWFNLTVLQTNHTGTGNMRVSLPFIVANVVNGSPPPTILAENLTFSNSLAALCNTNQTYIALYTFSSNAAAGAVAMDTTCTLYISGVYQTT